MHPLRTSLLVLLLAAFVAPLPAEAQLGKRIKDRIKRDAEQRVEDRAVEAARRTLDLAEDAIVCLFTDEACIEAARAQGSEPVIVDESGKPISGHTPAATAPPPDAAPPADHASTENAPGENTPGEGVWANYDFVSGDRVLFFHDFEDTRTGNFPSRVDYLGGNMEVVELGANKALRVGGERGGTGCLALPLGEAFPERYTIEFRARTSDPQARATWHLFSGAQEPLNNCRYAPKPHVLLTGYQGAGLTWDGGQSDAPTSRDLVVDAWADVRISVDGPYWKVYVNERRVANVPRFDFPVADALNLMFGVYRADIYIDDVRVAEGGPRSLYDDLMREGFLSTTAIRFDTGSATLRPESTGILNELRAMLEDHADLALTIEGHTDSRGADAANQTLSAQRAEAVAAWLTARGIDAGRLDAIGHGESQPAAENTTPEGMAQNRRVVFRVR